MMATIRSHRFLLLLSLLAAPLSMGVDRCEDEDPPGTPPPSGPDACFIGGCSSELCTDDPGAVSTCEVKPEAVCFETATCERQADGACGWTETPELLMCLGGFAPAPDPCYVGGCSGQLCSDTPGVASTCEWRDEYACYRDATCERQADGACGWTETPELTMCLAGPSTMGDCYIGGCSAELCTDDPGAVSTCEVKPEAVCYETATCARQADGACGWTQTPELRACLDSPPSSGGGDCYVGGCSGQLCSDTPGLASTCEWRPEYACYHDATCERQTDGSCGWTETPELTMCLASPPPAS